MQMRLGGPTAATPGTEVAGGPRALPRLVWAARRWWWTVLLAFISALVLVLGWGARAGPRDDRYEASALLVAQQLAIRPEQLPRYAESVFSGGSVSTEVSESLGGRIAPRDLIPEHIELEPVLGTIALRVIGRANDAETASQLADRAAVAYVGELNEAGPGVGFFAVQDAAGAARVTDGPLLKNTLVALSAAACFALGTVGLLVLARRPIIEDTEAAAVIGAPLVGTVLLPRMLGRRPDARSVIGLEALGRSLLPDRRAIALLGGWRAHTRASLGELLVEVVGARLPASLVQPKPGDAPSAEPDRAVVVDFVDADVDPRQVLEAEVGLFVVVDEGTPRATVARATAQYIPGELSGVVFVTPVFQWPRRRRPSALRPHPATAADHQAHRDQPAATSSATHLDGGHATTEVADLSGGSDQPRT
jgi:hypothetical protein